MEGVQQLCSQGRLKVALQLIWFWLSIPSDIDTALIYTTIFVDDGFWYILITSTSIFLLFLTINVYYLLQYFLILNLLHSRFRAKVTSGLVI